jgi:hypothetical protein
MEPRGLARLLGGYGSRLLGLIHWNFPFNKMVRLSQWLTALAFGVAPRK